MNKPLQVLIVDDNPVERTLLAGLLKKMTRWKIHPVTCATGTGALRRIRAQMPDIAFVDYRLEGETGTDLIRQLKEAGCRGGFILFTGMEGDEAIVAALRAGAHDYLRKTDLSIETLSRSIHHTLEKVRTDQALEQANAALQEAKKQLEKRVLERTAQLSEAREQLDFITTSANDAIIMLDPRGHVIFWNPAAQRIFGYTNDQILSAPFAEHLVPPEDRKAFTKGMHHFRDSGEGPLVGQVNELNALRQNGEIFPAEVSLSAIHIQGAWYAAGIVRDITRRKQVDAKMRQAKEQAEQATRLKDRFVSLVAHDLRGPFTTILGFLELLDKDRKHPLSKKQRGYVKWVRESSAKMLEMVDEILNISRLQTGKIQPQTRFVNARFLADKVLDHFRPLADKKQIDLDNELPESFRLHVDPGLFREVVHNLISNAVKFCRKGDRITLFRPEGEPATLAVRDTGVGIRKKRLAQIFQLEEKTSTTGTEGESGTGFGLPFSLELVKAHGGNLNVESKEGKGSTFYARMPEIIPQALVVDDDPDFRLLLLKHLRRDGVSVLEADCGKAALKLLEEQTIHLVICDIGLPRMSGFQVLETIRSSPKCRELPVLLVTADESTATREKAFQLGANDFITKPIVWNDFTPRVSRFVG
ncbi:MAG: response regulator [Magnetococcales bacterium]|nr:response regulator [Magnetococcales bacterium]